MEKFQKFAEYIAAKARANPRAAVGVVAAALGFIAGAVVF